VDVNSYAFPDAAGTVVLVTGATDGLGKAVAIALAKSGATVLLHGRANERLADVAAQILATTPSAEVRTYRSDFASLLEVANMAAEIRKREPRIDVLISNAGLGFPPKRLTSVDGYELVFQVNHLAGYLLICELTDLLAASKPARIVMVASAGQARIDFDDLMLTDHYEPALAYHRSKLAQIMTTFDLAERLPLGVTANVLHPSTYMPTKLLIESMAPKTSLSEGVGAVLALALDSAFMAVTGHYFNVTELGRAHPQAYDENARAMLRKDSDLLIRIALPQLDGWELRSYVKHRHVLERKAIRETM
jgi:NAD(P)-dependent dehydrogenase (short-subunit alcohol dehydrogenase family)